MKTAIKVLILVAASLALVSCGPASRVMRAPAREDRTVRVAGIVLKWITADKAANWRRAELMIREAAKDGAQLIVTTECFLDGYAIRDKAMPIEAWRALGETIPDGEYVRRLCRLAAELNVHLVAGLVERVGDTTYNTAILIAPDGMLIGKYRKQDLGHEAVRNTPGGDSPVFDTSLGRIGIIICADRRQPELVQRIARNRPDLIVCPSGGMWGPERNDHYLQARSRENRVPIVFVHPIEFLVTGPAGEILDRRFAGDTMSITPDQVRTPSDAQLVAMYDLSLRRAGP